MKMKQLCAGIAALAASFGALAQDAAEDVAGPSVICAGALANESDLRAIADKVDVAPFPFAVVERTPSRVANAHERKVIALWIERRDRCFDVGAEYRMKTLLPEEQWNASSLFSAQRGLTVRLLQGRMTYAEYNRVRFEMFKVTELEAGTAAAYAGW